MQFDLGGAPSRRSRQQRGLDLDFSAGKLGAEKPATVLRADKASPDWRAQFQAWINAHGYYPEAAAEAGQDGTVTLSFQVQTDGSVTGMRLAGRSGSPFLDQGAISIFRNQKVPPLPPGTRDPPVDVTLTINYILTRASR
jgi:protein TonB